MVQKKLSRLILGWLVNNALKGPLISHLLQVFACHLQLMIIVGMCLDSGKSWTTRFFKTRFMQFLGRISMALYLVHMIVRNVIILVIHGPFKWEEGKNDWRKGI